MVECRPNHNQLSEVFNYSNNELYCENTPVQQIERELQSKISQDDNNRSVTPLYIYSQAQLHRNIEGYKNAIGAANMLGRFHIFYAVKANPNLHLLELVRKSGCGAVTVSGYELRAALQARFDPEKILLNGNGKQLWEINLAIKHGCMLNLDSLFDVENIISVVRNNSQKPARVLIRVNPGLEQSNTPVHSYLATALKNSKFGVPLNQLDKVVELLKSEKLVQVVGLHCHIGSTIRDAAIYGNVTSTLLGIREKLVLNGYQIKYLDIGGGLGIDYYRGTNHEQSPLSSTNDLIQAIASVLPPSVEIIIEPGRSIMANTSILVTKVLGIKENDGGKQFVIVDAAMNDLIRPSFYQAYHHILPVNKSTSSEGVYDIVGPVCESGDFLALDRRLAQQPVQGDLLAVCDVGAYGMAMASNYNMRARAMEVLVDGTSFKIIRRRECFETLIQTMVDLS